MVCTRAAACALLALCLSLGLVAAQQKVQLPCERLTGVEQCIECTGADRACHMCHRDFNPVWTPNGMVKECKPSSMGAICRATSGDDNCARCDGHWCTRCKPGYFFNSAYECIPGTCPQISHNAACGVCNPDGSCTRCAQEGMLVMPFNAIHLNVPFPESQCVSAAKLNEFARTHTHKPAVMPEGCVQVDSEFKCNRCDFGKSLTGGKCVSYDVGNKCGETVPYRQYCSKCNEAGTQCTECNGSRSMFNGACSLPCKQLYGIGCRKCTPDFCTEIDPRYINGRK